MPAITPEATNVLARSIILDEMVLTLEDPITAADDELTELSHPYEFGVWADVWKNWSAAQ